MTFEQLEYFLKAAKYQSITKAANDLFISHSALSKSISALELELDTELFVRDNRNITLTQAGRYLEEQGTFIIKTWKETKEQIRFIANSVNGQISLCMPPLYESQLFTVLSEISSIYPDINFMISNMEPLRIPEALYNNKMDIGIAFSYQMQEADESIMQHTLYNDFFCAVINFAHPLAGKKSVSFQDLSNECIIYPPKVRDTPSDASLLSRIIAPPFPNSYQADSLEDMLFQLSINRGISIMPKSTMYKRSPNLRFLPITDVPDEFGINLIWKKDNNNPLLPIIINSLIDAFTN